MIKPFKDKYTKVIYQAGHEIEVTEERFEEINSAALGPFVKSVGESEKKPVEKPVEKPDKKSKSKINKTKSR